MVEPVVLLDGRVTLYCGDCREILPTIGGVQAVCTDPPYGIQYVTNHRKNLATPAMLAGDDNAPLWAVPMFADMLRDGGALYLATRFDVAEPWRAAIADSGLALKTPIFWDKGNWTAGDLDGDFGAQVEIFLFAHKGRHKFRGGRLANLWRVPRDPAGAHPTPKPVALMAQMILCSTDPDGLVADGFMGSGSTGVAAVKNGRRFVGVECNPEYFDIACRRIEEATKQPDFFVEPATKPKQESMFGDAA